MLNPTNLSHDEAHHHRLRVVAKIDDRQKPPKQLSTKKEKVESDMAKAETN